ncbi:MAG: translation initiation factor IF-3 [Dehalococcoidia bacterium]|nr:MAG: translation initiation factor IF-3 [Dehalococcoidia bacterium]
MTREVRRDIVKKLRTNRQIRAREIRLIGGGGEQLGVMPIEKALQLANEQNLDLVEVSSTSVPPVCRLLDYGKYKYEQTKKERKARRSQRASLLKEVRIRPRVKEHDLETKIRAARKLLEGGDKVRVFVVFRGREITHPELGLNALQKVTDDLRDIGVLDGSPSLDGRIMSLVFSPVSVRQTKEADVKEKDLDAEA